MPSPGNPQSLNRYSYTLNNPLKYTDPTGHAADAGGATGGCGTIVDCKPELSLPPSTPVATISPQIDYSDPSIWDQPYYLDPPMANITAFGVRVDASGPWPQGLKQTPIGRWSGPDMNLEIIGWPPTYEQDGYWGVFFTPGVQTAFSSSPKGGFGSTVGLVTLVNIHSPVEYQAQSRAPSPSYGGDLGYLETDMTISPGADGHNKGSIYQGMQVPPIPSEPALYVTLGKTLPILERRFQNSRYIKSQCSGMAIPPRGGC